MGEQVSLIDRWAVDEWPAKPRKAVSLEAVGDYDPTQRRDRFGRWTKGAPEPPPFPDLAYEEPPPATGVPGGKSGGYSSGEKKLTLTELGRIGEQLASQFGVDLGHREHDGRIKQQHPIDGLKGDWAIEVKCRLTTATEYRVGMKTHEIREKNKWAREHDKKKALMIVVLDRKSGKAWLYWRPGIKNGALAEKNGFKFVGTVETKP